jgi:hypothetical protein
MHDLISVDGLRNTVIARGLVDMCREPAGINKGELLFGSILLSCSKCLDSAARNTKPAIAGKGHFSWPGSGAVCKTIED